MSKTPTHVSDLSPEYALMGFLYLEPLHGYELHRRLELHLREVWRIPQNQAYNILKRLEKEGSIQPCAPADHRHPGAVPFTLTDAGRRDFEHWLYTPTPCSARAIRIEFLTRLFFATQLSAELPERFLREQDAAIHEAQARLQERLDALPAAQAFNRLSIELRIRQMNTLNAWLQSSALARQF